MRGRAFAGLALVVLAGGVLTAAVLSHRPAGTAPPEPRQSVAVPDLGRHITVEVLNAGGKQGVARDAMEFLRREGFDVVYYGNARKFGQDSSVVLDRVGDMAMARAVAQALAIRNVRSEPDSSLYLDVSVILGKRWHLPEPRTPKHEERRSLWDPRSWFGR